MTFQKLSSASAFALAVALAAAGGAFANPVITEIELSQAGIAHITMLQEVTGPTLTFTVPEASASDILASLVVHDPSGSVIELQTGTPRSMDAALLGTKFEAGLPGNLQELLGALIGETVSLTNRSGVSTGVVLGVRPAAPNKDGYPVALIFDGTDVREIVLEPGLKARLSPGTNQKLSKALATADTQTEQRQFDLTLRATNKRDVSLSYVTEAPAWKNAYRLLLDENRLQGWATFENTSGRDWGQVDLTLTTGFPIAYQSDLIDPKRIPRPDVRNLWTNHGVPAAVKQSTGGGMVSLMSMSAPETTNRHLLSMSSGSDQTFEVVNTNGILRYEMPNPITLAFGQTTSMIYFDAPIDPKLHALYRPHVDDQAAFLAVAVQSELGLAPGLISVQDAQGFVGDAPFPGALADTRFLLPVAAAVGSEVIASYDQAVSIETATYSGDTLNLGAKKIYRARYEASVSPEASVFTVEHPKSSNPIDRSSGTVVPRATHYEISTPVADGIAKLDVVESEAFNREIEVSASSFGRLLESLRSSEAEAPAAMVAKLSAAHQILVERTAIEDELTKASKRYDALLQEQKRRRANLEVEKNTELLERYEASMAQVEQQILEVFDNIDALKLKLEGLDENLTAKLEDI